MRRRHHRTSRVGIRARVAFALAPVLIAAAAVALLPHATGTAHAGGEGPGVRGAVTILWVGDTTPGSYVGLPPGDGDGLFSAVRARLRGAGITVGNLEGTLAAGGSSKCGAAGPGGTCFAFQAPQRYAKGLRRAGFDVMNMANNHAMDFGRGVYWATVRALRGQRIARTGAPGLITVVRRNGTRVAFVGFSAYHWTNPMTDLARTRTLVRRAATRADVVVVVMHAGAEGSDQTHVPYGDEVAFGEDRGNTRAFAHTAIDAGADLVLGSGPHVIRGVERYHHRLIAYSLGNFASQGTFARGGVLSLSGMLELQVDARGRVLGGRWKALELTGQGTPVADPTRMSTWLVRRLSGEDFGARAWPIGVDGRLAGVSG